MPTVAITLLDLACCRCRSKIQKILCCIQERCGFVFDKVVYEKGKVVVSGPFDAIELCCKLRCKAGCFVTNIEIVPPPPPPTPKKDDKKKTDDKANKNPKPEAAPSKPKPIPYQYPYPYLYPSPSPYPQPPCPSRCPSPPRPCQCHSCKPPPPSRCPAWTPCHCRGYRREYMCWEENLPDGPCAVM